MGRPRELTEHERQELLAKGYKPVEMWIPDVDSEAFWQSLEREGTAIREADRRSHMNEVLESLLDDNWDDLG